MDGFGWWITKELCKSAGKITWEVVKLPVTIPMHIYENSGNENKLAEEKKDEDND